MPQPGLAGSLS